MSRSWHPWAATLFLAVSGCGAGGSAADTAPVVAITAQQWSFTPSTVTLKKGTTVNLALTSKDVHHGFNLPDFNVRADFLPGQTTTVPFTPDRAGTFLFHCDYFCGSGHEEMQGQIVVE